MEGPCQDGGTEMNIIAQITLNDACFVRLLLATGW